MKTPAKSKTGKSLNEVSLGHEDVKKPSKSKKPRFDEDDEMEFENFEDFIELDYDEDDDF